MEDNELLPAEVCCHHYNIQYNFLELLNEHGLIEIVNVEERHFLHAEELQNLEPLIRMHYDLDINVEGIEAINNILLKMKSLQNEVLNLRNKLSLYEDV